MISWESCHSCLRLEHLKYKANKSPKGIIMTAVPLPCLFNNIRSLRWQGSRPDREQCPVEHRGQIPSILSCYELLKAGSCLPETGPGCSVDWFRSFQAVLGFLGPGLGLLRAGLGLLKAGLVGLLEAV